MKKFVLSLIVFLSLSSFSLLRADPELFVERGHSELVGVLAFSPDGGILASAAFDGSIRLWDETGAWRNSLLTRDGIGAATTALAFSPDGKLLAAGTRDGEVRLWRVPEKSGVISSAPKPWKFGDGTVIRKGAAEGEKASSARMGDEEVVALAFSSDGKSLAASGYYGHSEYAQGGARLRVWNTQNGDSQWTQTFFDGVVSHLAFDKGSTLVAARAPNIVQRIDGEGRELERVVLPEEGARPNQSTLLALSPDGTRALTKGKDDYKIYDTRSGEVVVALQANPAAADPRADQRRREMAERMGRPAPDPNRPAPAPANLLGEAVGATFSPDSQSVAIVFWQTGARIWNAIDGKESTVFVTRRRSNGALALSKTGLLALSDDAAKVGLWQNGELKTALPQANNPVAELEFFTRGLEPILLVGYRDGALAQWNLATGKIEKITGQTGRDLTTLAVSPDGNTLAVAGYLKSYTSSLADNGVGRGQLQAVDLKDNKVLWTRQDAGRSKLSQLRFSKDSSQLIIASEGGGGRTRAGAVEGEGFAALEFLNARSGEQAEMPFDLGDEEVYSADTLEMARNESKLAIYGSYDVRVWDVPEGKLRLRLNSSGFEGNLLKLSPTGNFLAITNPRGDGAIRLWDVTRERNTGRGRGNDETDVRLRAAPNDVAVPPIRALEYSGSRLLAGDARGRVLAWSDEMSKKGEAPAPPVILEDEIASAVTALRGAPETRLPNIAATGHADGAVRLWDLKNEKLLATLTLIPTPAAEEPVVLNLKQPEGKPQSLETFDWTVWTPDGKYDASPGAETLLRWREGEAILAAPRDVAARRRADVLQQALKPQ